MIETRQQHAWKARAERERALLKAYSFKWYKDGDSWLLFAPGGEETTKQVALQEIRELQKSKPWHEVVRWARDLKNAVFLDSETTGFGKEDVIIDIAVTDKDGKVLVNTLVHTERETIPKAAQDVHHIDKAMLCNAPMWTDIWPDLADIFLQHPVIIYNADYDMRMIRQMVERYGLQMPAVTSHCLMKKYSEYCGCSRYLKLDAACLHFDVRRKNSHRALADAQDSRHVLCGLANVGSIDGHVQESFGW